MDFSPLVQFAAQFVLDAFKDAGANLWRYSLFAIGLWFAVWVVLAQPLASRRIRSERPPNRQLALEFLISLRSIVIFSVVGAVIATMSRAGLIPGFAIAEAWGPWYGWLALAAMIVGHDAYFYWTHRTIHNPRLFRRVHLRHHRSNNPSPFTAYSFDLGEAFLMALFVFIWVQIVPTPGWATGLFMLHQIVRNTIGHLGYEFYPARPNGKPLLDFMTTTTHHDLHHAQAGWNYGLYFTWWDRLMKTEHPEYHARFAEVVQRKGRKTQAPVETA